jgi:3-dehydroquinate dehydratase-1
VISVLLVVSVPDAGLLEEALASGADAIEVRLDLLKDAECDLVREALGAASVPLIVTIRTAAEGGAFAGTAEEWRERLEPWLGIADYVDVERPYAAYADDCRKHGAAIIASVHRNDMPGTAALEALRDELRGYGDIPKIIVTPSCTEDVITLLTFTATATKPIATGVLGEGFRYMRAILPLFGSELVYCHAGVATSPGQYHIGEMRRLMEMLQ